MRKRGRHDPLKPITSDSWLVVRNQLSEVIESQHIEPLADLRAILIGARAERIAAGWIADELGDRLAFFFCRRASERVLVSIEQRRPPKPGERR